MRPEPAQAQSLRHARACRTDGPEPIAPADAARPMPAARPAARPTTPSWARSPTRRSRRPGAKFTVTDVRRLWPEVLEEVKGKRRFTWILLSQNAQVAELRGNTLLLAMTNAGARDSFGRGGSEDVLREAMVVVLGADFKIEAMVEPGNASAASPRTPPPADRRRPEPAPHRRARGTAGPGAGPAGHPTHPGGPRRGRDRSRRARRGGQPGRRRPGRRGRVPSRPADPPPRGGDHRRGRAADT